MRLEFTPQGIADVEEKTGKSFVELLGNQDAAISVKNLLLVLSAGLEGDITRSSEYLIDWCERNEKTYFEIYEHITEKLEASRFFSLDAQAQAQGEKRKAIELALSKNTGKKARK